mgnify:FL=1
MCESMLEINQEEAICLYRLLKKQESDLDNRLIRLLTKIERMLYEKLSIEELERLSLEL